MSVLDVVNVDVPVVDYCCYRSIPCKHRFAAIADAQLDHKLDNSLYIEQPSVLSPVTMAIFVVVVFIVMSADIGAGFAARF